MAEETVPGPGQGLSCHQRKSEQSFESGNNKRQKFQDK